MNNIYCGIVLGPNSTQLLKYMMPISEKLAHNKITWVICPDIKNQENNDILFLKNKENVLIINGFDCNSKSGGERHGTGINKIVEHLKNNEKIIIMEPDLIPIKKNWDEILLSKLNENITFISPKTKNGYYTNSNDEIIKRKYNDFALSSQCKLPKDLKDYKYGDFIYVRPSHVCLLCLNPKKIIEKKVFFHKLLNLNIPKEHIYNEGYRSFTIKDSFFSEYLDYPINTVIQKETGWGVPFVLNKKNMLSLNLYNINVGNIRKHPADCIFELIFDKEELLALHLHHSRYAKDINPLVTEIIKVLKLTNNENIELFNL